MEPGVVDELKDANPEDRTIRFRVVRDDAPMAMLTFEILEARRGSLELIEPSSRGYERYYLAVALAVLLFALPFLLGLLPWQILLGAARGLPPSTVGESLLYFVLVLGSIVGGTLYLPRLAERRPAATLPVTVVAISVSPNPKIPPRMRIRAGDDDVWLTAYARPKDFRSALGLSGQTEYDIVPSEGPRNPFRRRRNVTKPI